mmetsp:Transcript_27997/g.71823  ORF Transcript_27997/g.71823 Transcript_27997/m.71823 type:complete len:207 (-) Transcript_27997:381-1001(-)
MWLQPQPPPRHTAPLVATPIPQRCSDEQAGALTPPQHGRDWRPQVRQAAAHPKPPRPALAASRAHRLAQPAPARASVARPSRRVADSARAPRRAPAALPRPTGPPRAVTARARRERPAAAAAATAVARLPLHCRRRADAHPIVRDGRDGRRSAAAPQAPAAARAPCAASAGGGRCWAAACVAHRVSPRRSAASACHTPCSGSVPGR